MSPPRRVLLALCSAVGVGACFWGADLGGFSGGDVADASGSSADGGEGGALPDGGSGGSDAAEAPLGDAGALPFCATYGADAAVCADFDESATVSDGFDQVVSIASSGQATTGNGERDTSAFLSGPASLHVTVPPFTASPERWVAWFLRREVRAPAAGRVHLEVAVRPNKLGPQPTMGGYADTEVFNVVLHEQRDGAASYVLTLTASEGLTRLIEATSTTDTANHFLRKRLTVGQWSRLALDLDFAAKTIRMTSDGVDVFDGARPMLTGATGGYVQLEVGTPAAYHEAGASLNIDDVLLRVEP